MDESLAFDDPTIPDAAAGGSERAREAAMEFQALADNIPTLCWMAYADGDIYWYNARWHDYTGTSPEDQRGWGWESVHDPEVLPAVVERWKHSLATGAEFEMTFPLRGADGKFRPFLTRVVPIRDEGGTIVRWFGSNTDVSALKLAEDELRASEARLATQIAELKALYDSAPIGLAFFSRDYRYLRINDELAAINGVPVDDHIGRTIREVLSDQAPEVEPVIDHIFATGESMRDLEVSGETPQQPGVVRHWLAGFYPVKDEAGAVAAVGAWVVEISERKAAEQREHLLAREVDHRAKNLLAVVQSVMQLTPRRHRRRTERSGAGTDPVACPRPCPARQCALGRGRAVAAHGRGNGPVRRRSDGAHRPLRRCADAMACRCPVAGAGDPRACDQRRQIWRAVDDRRSRRDQVGGRIRSAHAGARLDRAFERRHSGADEHRLRLANHQRQRRAAAPGPRH
jgi:PAS domain S-box-containing protein